VAARAWRDAPLAAASPRGRVAALAPAGGDRPAAAHAEARALYAAWVEDSAVAAVFDAPTDVIAELAAALDLPPLDGAPPAGPAELGAVRDAAGVEFHDEHAPVVWLRERPDLELPAGALADVEATLRADLLEALRSLFDALAPGLAVVAIRV